MNYFSNKIERILALLNDFKINGLPIDASIGTTVSVEQDVHDDLNCNANIQINDTDVSGSNPIPIEVAASTSSLPPVEYKSPRDFTAAYTSSATITLSGESFSPTDIEIKYILVKATGGTPVPYINGVDGITLTISGSVITIAGATPFASGDTYEVGISGQKKAYDDTLESYLVNVQNPDYSRYTDKVSLVTNSDIGALDGVWVDQGAEISGNGYKSVNAWVVLTVNNSTGNQIKFLGKHTSSGGDRYELLDTIKFEANLGDSDRKVAVSYNCTGIPYVQIQTKATVVGATEGTVTIDITKTY